MLGNIGVPALEVLPKIKASDIVVFELSSFQLWDIAYSPDISVITNLEPDHLNVHKGFDDYVLAKTHIFAYQKPDALVVYNQNDPKIEQLIKNILAEQCKPFPDYNIATTPGSVVAAITALSS